ncbi:MAG: hypothetical protein M3P39_05140, partial [Actinomycetota bacterium]|nr:hypothetical protein [Actinomycetota bacterium]
VVLRLDGLGARRRGALAVAARGDRRGARAEGQGEDGAEDDAEAPSARDLLVLLSILLLLIGGAETVLRSGPVSAVRGAPSARICARG